MTDSIFFHRLRISSRALRFVRLREGYTTSRKGVTSPLHTGFLGNRVRGMLKYDSVVGCDPSWINIGWVARVRPENRTQQ
jgi:hypothetical protein